MFLDRINIDCILLSKISVEKLYSHKNWNYTHRLIDNRNLQNQETLESKLERYQYDQCIRIHRNTGKSEVYTENPIKYCAKKGKKIRVRKWEDKL